MFESGRNQHDTSWECKSKDSLKDVILDTTIEILKLTTQSDCDVQWQFFGVFAKMNGSKFWT